ncbi:MAG: cysteine desulfurase family protein [Rickettsiales bacterium]|nr:cysteine desulfurase family protein [Rickettsiales bacterium]
MQNNNKIFFDYNATTPLKPCAREAILQSLDAPLNPSSIHSFGRTAKSLLTKARNKILQNIAAEGQGLIFTSSGTESNNMIFHCLPNIKNYIISAVEHTSILKFASKPNVKIVQVDEFGKVNLAHFEEIIKSFNGEAFLASIILANNETGIVQDLSEIKQIVFANKGFLHTDASQALGKISFDFNNLGVDMATISAHKIGGGKGVAGFVIKKGLEISPFIIGGGQEGFLRGGTENLPAILGFAEAVEDSIKNLAEYQSHTSALTNYMIESLKKINPDIVFFPINNKPSTTNHLPNTILFAIPNQPAETMLIKLDLAGFAVSSGSACSSGRVNSSHVLKAMNIPDDIAKCAIRLSLGWLNTKEECDKFLDFIKNFAL